ncbi:MAG: TIGR01777 family oxidoreductase [Pyrinomonadaceae bacterium]
MRILLTGATGLVGTALTDVLKSDGHEVWRLVRARPQAGANEIKWQPENGVAPESSALENLDAVVHLAGESVSDGRWTPEKKRRIRESRVQGTALLAKTLTMLEHPPKSFVSASAVGYYGNRGDEILDERSTPGTDFLSGVCREWEAATASATSAGIQVTNLRIGIVLSSEGGALKKLLTPFQLGAGGKIGSGKQYMSWIAMDDAIAAIHHALTTNELSGAVNLVAPNPQTNAEFTETLGRVLGRPTLLTVPTFAARLAFGEMADALLLASQRVEPVRLKQHGFEFQYPHLEAALRHLLNR